MALIGIHIPLDTAEQLLSIKVPGTKVSPEDLHITMFDLGNNLSIDNLSTILTSVAEVLQTENHLKLVIDSIESFDLGRGKDSPIVAKINSWHLLELRYKIKLLLDRYEIYYDQKYPDYNPHTTLAYAPSLVMPFDIDPIICSVSHLVIWGGTQRRDGIKIQLPFGLVVEAQTLTDDLMDQIGLLISEVLEDN